MCKVRFVWAFTASRVGRSNKNTNHHPITDTMKKLFLALFVAMCTLSLTATAAGEKKKKEPTAEQKAFAEKHHLMKDGKIDRKAVKSLSAENKAAYDKLFPAKKKK